jgi:hypothetical protein
MLKTILIGVFDAPNGMKIPSFLVKEGIDRLKRNYPKMVVPFVCISTHSIIQVCKDND